jgi:hypothetical protein
MLSRTHSGERAVGKFIFHDVKYRLIAWLKFCLLWKVLYNTHTYKIVQFCTEINYMLNLNKVGLYMARTIFFRATLPQKEKA